MGVSAGGVGIWKAEEFVLPLFVCGADNFVGGVFFLQTLTGKRV